MKILGIANAVLGIIKSTKIDNISKKTPKVAQIVRAIGIGGAGVGGALYAYSDPEALTALIAEITILIGAVSALVAQLQAEK